MSETTQIIPIEKQMEVALISENVTEEAIVKIENEFLPLTLELGDKERYIEVVEAHKGLKKFESVIIKVCKAGREDAIAIQKAWVAKEKELIGRVEKVTDHVGGLRKKYEAEEERKKEEKKRKEQENLFNRSKQLTSMGAELIDGALVLEGASIDLVDLQSAAEETYQNIILADFMPIWERKEAERIESECLENERKAKEESDRLELLAKQKELEAKEAEFKKQQEDFQKQQAQAEAEKKRIKDESDNKRWRSRLAELKEIGWNSQYAFSRLGDEEISVFTYDELVELSDDAFEKRKKEYNDSVTLELDKRERNRLDDIEKQKQAAAAKAVEEERQRVQAQKEADEAEAERKRIEEQERQEKANDSQKWVLFVDKYFSDFKFPEMKSPKYRKVIAMAKEKIEEIQKLA